MSRQRSKISSETTSSERCNVSTEDYRRWVVSAVRQTAQELGLREASPALISEVWNAEWEGSGDPAAGRAAHPGEGTFLPTAPLIDDRALRGGAFDRSIAELLNLDSLLSSRERDTVYLCPRCGANLLRPAVSRKTTPATAKSSETADVALIPPSTGVLIGAIFPVREQEKSRRAAQSKNDLGLVRFLREQGVRTFLTGDRMIRVSEESLDQVTHDGFRELSFVLPTSKGDVAGAAPSASKIRTALVPVLTRSGLEEELPRYFEEASRLGAAALLVAQVSFGERKGSEFPILGTLDTRIVTDRWLCAQCFLALTDGPPPLTLRPSPCPICRGPIYPGSGDVKGDEEAGKGCGFCDGSGLAAPSFTILGRTSHQLREMAVGEFLDLIDSTNFWPGARLHTRLAELQLAALPTSRYLSQLSHGERIKLLLLVRVLERSVAVRFFADDLLNCFEDGDRDQVVALTDLLIEQGNEVALFTRQATAEKLSEPATKRKRSSSVDTFESSSMSPETTWISSQALPEAADIKHMSGILLVYGPSASGKSTYLRERLLSSFGSKARYLDFHRRPEPARRRPKLVLHELAAAGLIGQIFQSLPEARRYGFTATDFDPRTSRLRCAECDGVGAYIDGSPTWESYVATCTRCLGSGFEKELSAVPYQGQSIGELLATPLQLLAERFSSNSALVELSRLAQGLGIGELCLNRPMPTLGEQLWRIVTLAGILSTAPSDTENRRRGRRVAPGGGKGRRGKGGGDVARWWLLDQPLLSSTAAERVFALKQMRKLTELRSERFVVTVTGSILRPD